MNENLSPERRIPGTDVIGRVRATEHYGTLHANGRLVIPVRFQKEHELLEKNFYVLHFNPNEKTLFVTFHETNSKVLGVVPFSFSRYQGSTGYLEIRSLLKRYGLAHSPGKVELAWDETNEAMKIELADLIREQKL